MEYVWNFWIKVSNILSAYHTGVKDNKKSADVLYGWPNIDISGEVVAPANKYWGDLSKKSYKKEFAVH
jgi:hypothetical protein